MNYLDKNTDFQRPEIVSVFDEVSFWSAHFGRLLMENIPFRSDIKLLDVACGNGFPLFELAHAIGPSGRYYGIDSWPAALDRARMKREIYELENVQLILGDAHQLPWEASTFDMVVSNVGINNFEKPETAIKECFRVLKPGGLLVLTTNLRGHMNEFYEVYREVLVSMGMEELLPDLQRNIKHRADLETILGWYQAASFRTPRVVEDQFVMRYSNGTALLNHSLTVFGFLEGWRTFVPADKERALFHALEQRLNKLARKSGELSVSVPIAYIEGQKPN